MWFGLSVWSHIGSGNSASYPAVTVCTEMTESLEAEHWSRAEGSLALDFTSRGYNREAVYRTHRVLSTSHDIMVKGSRGESRSQIKSAKALRLPKCMYIPTSVLERNNRSHQHLLKTLGQISSPFQ